MPATAEPRATGTTDRNPLPQDAIGSAVRLIGAVHDCGPDEVAAVFTRLTRNDLLALSVTLAAMVPDDYTPAELLAWNDHQFSRAAPLPTVSVTGRAPLRPHGTHAAFIRHRTRKEEPCDPCWHGERTYQRERMRRRRSTTDPVVDAA